jgi:CubicO group peptidase (beta-lactamase class C family)
VGPEEEPRTWKQKGLALIGWAVFVAVMVGVGIFSFVRSMAMPPLHPNPADVPSVIHAAPSQEWAEAAEQGRQLARTGLVERNLPGLSVAAGVGGDIVWAEGFGWADLENRVPVAPNMRFRIGHASKALTSAAVGLLVERGLLDLDEEIQTYAPAFPRQQWTVTLRQLMGHVAGVRHYDNEADYMPSEHCERASEGVQRFADDALRFQPETQYAYSTFGWILVSAAVESAANEPFFTFMRSRILEPLGMRDTTTESVTAPIPNLVTFYDPRFSGDPAFGPEVSTRVDYSCFAGGGAFLSTPSDLVRFGMAVSGGTLLKPATVSLLQAPQRLLSGEETEYGLGWMLATFPLAGEPTREAGHASRTMLGSSTSFVTYPEHRIAVAVMSNTSDASLKGIAVDVAQAFAKRRRSPQGK